MDVAKILSRAAKGEREDPPERALQSYLAKRGTVSLPLLANLLGAVGFAGGVE
jgi:hypothetical protein